MSGRDYQRDERFEDVDDSLSGKNELEFGQHRSNQQVEMQY